MSCALFSLQFVEQLLSSSQIIKADKNWNTNKVQEAATQNCLQNHYATFTFTQIQLR